MVLIVLSGAMVKLTCSITKVNGRYVDTRGGVWTGKSDEYEGRLFLSLRSVSSGTIIIVML